MTVIPFPTPQLKLDVRKLRRSKELVDIGIRFRRHDDPTDVEEVRWNIQGNVQRRGGIPRAKGFKLRECALARTWFEFTLEPEQLPRFVHEILPTSMPATSSSRSATSVWLVMGSAFAVPEVRPRARSRVAP